MECQQISMNNDIIIKKYQKPIERLYLYTIKMMHLPFEPFIDWNSCSKRNILFSSQAQYLWGPWPYQCASSLLAPQCLWNDQVVCHDDDECNHHSLKPEFCSTFQVVCLLVTNSVLQKKVVLADKLWVLILRDEWYNKNT